MKKLLAIFFASILSLPAYSETITNLNISISNISINDKVYPLNVFTGEYNLLSYKINISLKSDKNLFIDFENLPLSKQFPKEFPFFFYTDRNIDLIKQEAPSASNSFDAITFPYNKQYQLIPIGGLTFILKNSSGFSIEFKNIDNHDNRTLIFRDSNGSILDKEKFDKIISKKEYEQFFTNSDLSSNKESKISDLKDNMRTFRTVLETFNVDWGGVYPDSLIYLMDDAGQKRYWKDFLNPYTEQIGLGKNGSVISYKEYKNYKPHPSLKGLVVFEHLNCSYDKVEKKNQCSSYKIYGTDENGNLIQDKGKVFFLTNE